MYNSVGALGERYDADAGRVVGDFVLTFQGFSELAGGSGGGTPHSGRPFGRCIRLGSQSCSAAELSFCARVQGAQFESRDLWSENEGTYEIFLPNIELLPILRETQLLLLVQLPRASAIQTRISSE